MWLLRREPLNLSINTGAWTWSRGRAAVEHWGWCLHIRWVSTHSTVCCTVGVCTYMQYTVCLLRRVLMPPPPPPVVSLPPLLKRPREEPDLPYTGMNHTQIKLVTRHNASFQNKHCRCGLWNEGMWWLEPIKFFKYFLIEVYRDWTRTQEKL